MSCNRTKSENMQERTLCRSIGDFYTYALCIVLIKRQLALNRITQSLEWVKMIIKRTSTRKAEIKYIDTQQVSILPKERRTSQSCKGISGQMKLTVKKFVENNISNANSNDGLLVCYIRFNYEFTLWILLRFCGDLHCQA